MPGFEKVRYNKYWAKASSPIANAQWLAVINPRPYA